MGSRLDKRDEDANEAVSTYIIPRGVPNTGKLKKNALPAESGIFLSLEKNGTTHQANKN
jgi:hypothetical protein